MGTLLDDLIPHLLALLVGGLASSFGLTALARRPAGRALLARVRGWGMVAFAVAAVSGMLGGFYWLLTRIGGGLAAGGTVGSPWRYLLLGVLTGLPLSLPGVITLWSGVRSDKAEPVGGPREKAASRRDRLEYARALVRKIEEYAVTPREISATVTGDEGRVLRFAGDLERHEGDRLAAALREELEEHGFTRLEGEGPKGDWWSRV